MPNISSIYAKFHVAQDLIYALHNPEPENPLYKLGNEHKDFLRNLEEIFSKVIPPKYL